MIKSLKDCILEARKNGVAIGHFNVSTVDGIWAAADAAQALGVPVIIGVSEGERDYIGVREAAGIVHSIQKERNQLIFINADHTYSYEKVAEAVDAGFDAVIFDGAKLSFDENVAMTKKCLAYAKQKNPDIIFEAELGYIGQSSQVISAVPTGVQLTSPDEAKRFADITGIDMLAPAVGNFHGLLAGDRALTLAAKKINPDRVREIAEATGLPLVLHGGSGDGDDAVRAAIKAGIAVVHVNTELRVAYRAGLVKSLTDNPDEVAPYKYMKPAKLAMQAVITEKLKLFSGM
jgi:fructose-bisphosphate aldolase, class II